MPSNSVDVYAGPGNQLHSVHPARQLRAAESMGTLSGPPEHRSPQTSKSRRRLACSSCRQAKIKCDSSSAPLGRCKRCLARNEECRINAGFKRVQKKQTVAQLQEQIDRLNSVLGNAPNQMLSKSTSKCSIVAPAAYQPTAIPPSLPAHSSTSSHSDNTLMSTWGGHGPSETNSPVPPLPPLLSRDSVSLSDNHPVPVTDLSETFPTSRRIGEVTIDGREVDELFTIFFEHYHPFLPLLEDSLSPVKYYESSVLLFWAIITVASRHYESDPTLITSLADPVTALLWKKISTPPHSIDLVQAILLITTWSFPTTTMHTDPSLTIISIAKAAALTLGLHRPETIQDFLRVNTKLNSKEIQEAVKTWAGCYIAAQSVTSSIGQQPLFTVDWAIDRACQTENIYRLPEEIRHRLLIQQFSSYVSQVMSENRQNPAGLPSENEIGTTLAFLERGFEDLQRQLNGNLTTINRVMMCCASLQLRAFYFFERPCHRQRGLLKCYSTALSLINMAEEAAENFSFVIYAPTHFGHILLTAGVIVLKVLHSSFSTFLDISGGKRAFNLVVTLLRRASIEDNDLPGRSSKILAQLWAVHDTSISNSGQGNEPTLRLKTRSSASVMHDALWVWRDKFAKQGTSSTSQGPRHVLAPAAPSTVFDVSESISHPQNISQGHVAPEISHIIDESNPNFNIEGLGAIWDMNLPWLLPMGLDTFFAPEVQQVGVSNSQYSLEADEHL